MPQSKLFGGLVYSTVWRESHHVRIVWITMLALAERDGVVNASVVGLADAARVTLEECEEALEILRQPDPLSRTQSHEGRRLCDLECGWRLLNYERHWENAKSDYLVEANTERQRLHRERKRARAIPTGVPAPS